LLLSPLNEVDTVLASSTLGFWEVMTAATAHKEVDEWAERVGFANLLGSDLVLGSAVEDVRAVDGRGCVRDTRGDDETGLEAIEVSSL
jgi:hypothetical protein